MSTELSVNSRRTTCSDAVAEKWHTQVGPSDGSFHAGLERERLDKHVILRHDS